MSNWATRELPKPSALIQWKGTNVCMDCHCLCGESFHLDEEFAYAVTCPHCFRRYEMSAMIEMREMQTDEVWDGCIVGPEAAK